MSNLGTSLAGLGFKKRLDNTVVSPDSNLFNGKDYDTVLSEIGAPVTPQLEEDIDGQAVITSFNIEHDILGDGSALATYELNGDANDLNGIHNGTASNVTYSDGKIGQGAVFDGSSSKIDLPFNTVSYPFSVSSWVKPNDWNIDGQMIVSLNIGVRFSIMIHSWGGNGNLIIAQGGQAHFKCDIGTSSDFVNVVVVANGVNDYNVFVDGVEVNLVNVGATHGNSGSNCIGSNGVGGEFFNGIIDQVRFFNKALNELDVSELYNEKLSASLTQEDDQPNWNQYQATAINPVGDLEINGLIQELESTLTENQSIVQVACGYEHTFALLNDGTVKAVGYNGNGQLGIGNTTHQQYWVTSNISNVESIACGGYHTMAVLNDGTVKAVGYNEYGQLGIGSTTDQTSWVTSGITDVASIGCGTYYSMALLNDGTVKAVGNNSEGEFGIGSRTDYSSWVTSDITDVASIACGGYHVMAILNDGTVKAVGFNYQGQLGFGSTSLLQSTWSTSNITDVASFACGQYHTFAILNDGTVKAVGHNEYGQLGNGNTTHQSSWVTSGITDVASIACGYYYSMAVLNDGTVKGVGYNGYGQLGDGNTTTQSSWVTSGITDVTSIACGTNHTFAVLNDGTVKGVGYNGYGQLGIDNYTDQSSWVTSSVPVELLTINTYVAQTVDTNELTISGTADSVTLDLWV